MGQYKHKPICLGRDSIRLILLLKGTSTDPIQGEVLETFLCKAGTDAGVPYEALSYCWGKEPESETIYLDRCEFRIRINLYQALWSMRREESDRLLWVDAICIAQKDLKEKTHQVAQMRCVYEKADQVLVWLGAYNQQFDEINFLMDIMNDLYRRAIIHQDYRRYSDSSWRSEWDGILTDLGGPACNLYKRHQATLRKILDAPWFRRVWVLQEVASAKRATVICGRRSVPARVFSRMPSFMEVEVDAHVQSVLEIMPGQGKIGGWWKNNQPDLQTMLRRFKTSEATDPRDRVYALLGISSDAKNDGNFRPDYEISMKEFIRNSVSYLLFRQILDPSIFVFPALDISDLYRDWGQLSQVVFDRAMLECNEVLLKALLATEGRFTINNMIRSMGTLLIVPPQQDPLSSVRPILEHSGATVHTSDTPGRYPLHLALERGYKVDIINLLLDRGAHFDAEDIGNQRALFYTVEKNSKSYSEVFLQRGVSADSKNFSGTPALCYAAENGYRGIVELLLDRGASTDSKTFYGETALILAVQNGQRDIVRLLLQRGADVDYEDFFGYTALSTAREKGYEDIIRLLLDKTSNY